MRIRSTSGTPSSMPARVWPRSPVHIFSTPTASTVPVPASVASVARCRAEDPPAQELSTFTMPAWRRPARMRKVWPRMQPWSSRRPAVALPNTTRLTSAGSTPASARASATTWLAISAAVRSRRFMGEIPVPTMCAVASTVTFLLVEPSGGHAGRRQGGDQALELVHRSVGGDVHHHVLGAGPRGTRPPPRPPRRRCRGPGAARRPGPGCRTGRTSTPCPARRPDPDRRRC